MAGKWGECTLAELAADEPYSIQIGPFGSKVKAENYVSDGIPYLRGINVNRGRFHDGDFVYLSEEFADKLRPFWCRSGDILLVHRGTIGPIGIIPDDAKHQRYVLGNSMLKFTCDPRKTNPKFVYYWLRSSFGQNYLTSCMSQTGVPAIASPLKTLRATPILLPTRPEQDAIASILDYLDSKIELNQQMNETLEAIARTIFKSWFVDFDPVRAKAEGRDPSLPESLAKLFPARLVDSEMGEIPEGWEAVALPEAMDVNPPRFLRKGEVAPYLDMANMPTRGHTPNTIIQRLFGSGMRFVNGDTLVARITPCLENGKTAFVDFLVEGQVGWGSTEYIVLGAKLPLPSEFGYCLARSPEFREFAIQSMTGTSGRQRVPPEALLHYLLAVPSEGVAVQFGRLVHPLFVRASQAARETRTLAALRDGLLPKLISGEIRLTEMARSCSHV